MVRTKWPRFFLICRAVRADAAPRAGRHLTGPGARPACQAWPPPPRSPPASAGAKRCFQAYSRLALIPNSWAITSADLRRASQLLTASRLNVASNLRRVLTVVCVMGGLVHCRPNPPSVNSKQPDYQVFYQQGQLTFSSWRDQRPLDLAKSDSEVFSFRASHNHDYIYGSYEQSASRQLSNLEPPKNILTNLRPCPPSLGQVKANGKQQISPLAAR